MFIKLILSTTAIFFISVLVSCTQIQDMTESIEKFNRIDNKLDNMEKEIEEMEDELEDEMQ
jgi:hypothetical protein